jgi:hypothetical protein
METCQILNVPLYSANNEYHIFRLGCWILTRDKFQLCFTLANINVFNINNYCPHRTATHCTGIGMRTNPNRYILRTPCPRIPQYNPAFLSALVFSHFLFYASGKYDLD